MTHDQIRWSRAALSAVCEPGDVLASLLVYLLGAPRAFEVVCGSELGQEEQEALLQEGSWAGLSAQQVSLKRAQERWRPRVAQLEHLGHPEKTGVWAEAAKALSAVLLIPEDLGWPAGLAALGIRAPLGLWVRGRRAAEVVEKPLLGVSSSIAIVGSRAASSYGLKTARDFAASCVSRGIAVFSGGAYGIDAAAHRGALLVDPESARVNTVAVLAGGIDRLYPAGNAELLMRIGVDGFLVSEIPLGGSPTKWRFLQRNRLIAAMSSATLVVEAQWRSGALSTAHHALELGRNVGAVPGSIYVPQSAGTHRLLRESEAVPVTSSQEACELVDARFSPMRERSEVPRQTDGLGELDFLVREALPKRQGSTTAKLAVVAGVSENQVRAALGRLQFRGLAEHQGELWRLGSQPS